MTKEVFPFGVPDISALAKHIKKEIDDNQTPSHLEVLNILARGAGYKNFQHFRAANAPNDAPITVDKPNQDALKKITKYFDNNLVLMRFPPKESHRELCLWFFWSRIPQNAKFNEIAFSKYLNGLHSFGDAALIRRYLIEYGFVSRSRDGSDYQRIELEVPAEVQAIVNMSKDDIPVKKKRDNAAYPIG